MFFKLCFRDVFLARFKKFKTGVLNRPNLAFEKKVSESLTMPKKLKGDHLVSPGIVSNAEKKEQLLFQFLVPNGPILEVS